MAKLWSIMFMHKTNESPHQTLVFNGPFFWYMFVNCNGPLLAPKDNMSHWYYINILQYYELNDFTKMNEETNVLNFHFLISYSR
jgi:hypothetical protein